MRGVLGAAAVERAGGLDPGAQLASLIIEVNYRHDWVAGVTDPYETVLVKVYDSGDALKDEAVIPADAAGDFFIGSFDWNSGEAPDILPGDRVDAETSGASAQIDPVGVITGQMNEAADIVTGTLQADWLPDPTMVNCEIWEDFGPTIQNSVDPDGGEFGCDFAIIVWDLYRGDQVALRYYDAEGDSVVNVLEWPWLRVDYSHDWVGANYEIGHTMWYTLTESDQVTVKATGFSESSSRGGWSGPGFQSVVWTPAPPDILSGDWIHVTSDDGYSHSLQTGVITGTTDVINDRVGGRISAPGSSGDLDVKCHPWGAWSDGFYDVPVKHSSAAADGSSEYDCQWDHITEWDMRAFQDIGVMYVESDWDRVINVLNDREVHWLELMLGLDGSLGLSGLAENGTVLVSTPYVTHTTTADPACLGCWTIDPAGPFVPGDTIQITAGEGELPLSVTIPNPLDVEINVAADQVSGQIGGWTNDEVDVIGNWPGGTMTVPTDGAGAFLAIYPDIPPAANGQVVFSSVISRTDVIFKCPFESQTIYLPLVLKE